MVSILISTQNDERWIEACLNAIRRQTFTDYEMVIIDRGSRDGTTAVARSLGVPVFAAGDALPGKALNAGIRDTRGDIVVCLAGHCIPAGRDWLARLVGNLDDPKVAGVYGRQEPMAFASDRNKRELLTVFGLDRRRQTVDSFFHSANCALRRSVWDEVPFDEETLLAEDRIWAQQVITRNLQLIYEPDAAVSRYTGIYPENDSEACRSVVRVLERVEIGDGTAAASQPLGVLDLSSIKVMALIPIRGPVEYLGGRPLIEYTIQRARAAKHIDEVVISTDDPELAEIARAAGASAPFLRPAELSADFVSVATVLQYTLRRLEAAGSGADVFMVLEATYPFRAPNLLDHLLERFVDCNAPRQIPVRPEYRSAWISDGKTIEQVSEQMPRKLKEKLICINLFGLGFVSQPRCLREGTLIGEDFSMVEIEDSYSAFEVRGADSLAFAEAVIGSYWCDG